MPSVLTEIAHLAKSHWAYPKEWIASWREDLTVSEKGNSRQHNACS